MNLPPLNIPFSQLRIRRGPHSDEVWDRQRQRYVALTPEEWVRQHFVNYLIDTLQYPAGLIGNEISMTLNGVRRRCDTIVYDRQGLPWMIIEYKAPDIHLSANVVAQALRYNLVMQARYITITNGRSIHCCAVSPDSPAIFLQSLPQYK